MRRLLVLGAGTAGTMVVNKLRKRLPREEWDVAVVEASDVHYYQPGFLFLPFSDSSTTSVVRPTRRYIPDGVTLIRGEVSLVRPEERVVDLIRDRPFITSIIVDLERDSRHPGAAALDLAEQKLVVGKDDDLPAPAAQLLDRVDRLAAAMAVMAAERIINHERLIAKHSVVVELREEEGERQCGLVACRERVPEARHRIGLPTAVPRDGLALDDEAVVRLARIALHAVGDLRDGEARPEAAEVVVHTLMIMLRGILVRLLQSLLNGGPDFLRPLVPVLRTEVGLHPVLDPRVMPRYALLHVVPGGGRRLDRRGRR